MAPRPCLDCGTLSTKARCPTHTRAADQARGSRQQRGLDAQYDRNRTILMANNALCSICGQPGTRKDPLTAGHIIGRAQGGSNDLSNLRVEHASYNYSQGKRCRGVGEQGQGGLPPS